MRRASAITALLLLLVFPGVMAFSDIAENFEAGGVAISGGGSLLYDGSNALNPANQFNYFSLSARVSAEILALDGLSISIGPNIKTTQTHFSNGNVSGSLNYGVTVGVSYYFLSGTNSPFVPSIGLGFGLALIPGTSVVSGGVTYNDKSLVVQPFLNLILVINWFVTQRTAFYLAFYPEGYMSVPVAGQDGHPAIDPRPFLQKLGLSATLGFGVQYFIPTRDKALVGR